MIVLKILPAPKKCFVFYSDNHYYAYQFFIEYSEIIPNAKEEQAEFTLCVKPFLYEATTDNISPIRTPISPGTFSMYLKSDYCLGIHTCRFHV